jgi:hypothetical protein
MHAVSAQRASPPAEVRVAVAAGRVRRTVWVRRPAGVVLVTSMVVAKGTRAAVLAVIPGVAGVGVDTSQGASNRCRSHRRLTICDRSQEWCPMPAARWRITVTKAAGPAGVIRVRFTVGRPRSA